GYRSFAPECRPRSDRTVVRVLKKNEHATHFYATLATFYLDDDKTWDVTDLPLFPKNPIFFPGGERAARARPSSSRSCPGAIGVVGLPIRAAQSRSDRRRARRPRPSCPRRPPTARPGP